MKPPGPTSRIDRAMLFQRSFRKAALWLPWVTTLLAGGLIGAHAQSPLDGFDPNANGLVRTIIVQPDGKILIGGEFTSLAPNGAPAVTRRYLARLNHNGSVDTNFNPNPNGFIFSIALQPDGKVLAGGIFTSIGGQSRGGIARLNATNGMADAFNPSPNSAYVESIVVQPDGKILVGGFFSAMGGQTRNRVARLHPATGLADAFNPNVFAGSVHAMVVQADGRVLLGGNFQSVGGHSRTNIARVDATTGAPDSFNPSANDEIWAIELQPDGKILVGGNFTNIAGQARNYIARLDPVTGLADAFNPNANAGLSDIVVQPDGKILVSGGFNNIGGQTRDYIARLDPETGLADSFDPDGSNLVLALALQPDGKVLIGGFFGYIGPQPRNNIARVESSGGVDRTLNLNVVATQTWEGIWATAVQPDGKILIGGFFTNILGVARTNIARLNADGTLDNSFNLAVNGTVFAIALQEDGKILIGGGFTTIDGQPRTNIARIHGVTGLPDSFIPNANNDWVSSIAVQADGKILVGGNFTVIGGQSRNYIARLDPTTGLADSFNPNANGGVYSIVVQADGRILVGGAFNGFNSIGGTARNGIARLDPATGLADLFNPGADDPVWTIALQADGRILVGGDFSSIGGAARNHIARLDATTGLADSFDPNANNSIYAIAVRTDGKILVGGRFSGTNSIGGQTRNRIGQLDPTTGSADSFDVSANNDVFSIAVQADGKILMAGRFTNVGGQPRNRFVRLSNDTVAQQNLAVTPATITWARGGSSPLFTRVIFEQSANNEDYTPLGHGTRAGSNWLMAGLSLPTGQNLYIRARGFYQSGYLNTCGSSIQESVRNVFFPTPPLRLNIRRSGNTNVVLSWPTNFAGFTLESKTNLNTNAWNVVSPAPVVSGTNNVVTNAAIGPARFYRLRK